MASLALMAPSFAADTAPLTWQACVDGAAKRNPDVAAAQEAVKAAEAQHRAAYSPFLPQLSLTASFTRSNTIAASPGLGAAAVTTTTNGTRDQVVAGLNATENLFSGFKDANNVRATGAAVDAAVAALSLAKAKLSFDLKSAFAGLLYAEEQLKLAEGILERRRANLRLVTLRYEGGRENKGSFLLSRAQLAQAEQERDQAKRALRVAARQLARAIAVPETEELSAVGELSTGDPDRGADFMALAKKTPDHVQAEAQLRQAEAQSAAANGAFLPSVDLSAFTGRSDDHFFPEQHRWSFGVSISYPFFPGGANLFNKQAALANERKAERTLRSVDDQLLVKLEQAHAAFADAVGQRTVAAEFLKASEARSTIATGKYTTGMMSFEDWDIIESDRINREKSALASRRDAVVAEAAWEQAQGKGAIP